MNIFETITDAVNNVLNPLMPFIEQYWMYLLGFPFLVIVYLVGHFGFGVW